MRTRLLVSCFAGLAGAVSLASTAGADSPSDLYFFGDSLSDTGGFCLLVDVFPGYETGRCTNGPNWTEQLADELGFLHGPSDHWLDGGNNFANGGDVAADIDFQIDLLSPPIVGLDVDPNALYVIWVGGNDVLDLPPTCAEVGNGCKMQQAVDDIADAIARLADLGAELFLVPNLPDIGRTYGPLDFNPDTLSLSGNGPYPPTDRARVSALSAEFNERLASSLASLEVALAITVLQLDVAALVEEVFASPLSFGFTGSAFDATGEFAIPCLEDTACAADPQGAIAREFFLFDAIHPTTESHGVIAVRAATVVPEPGALPLALAALLVMAGLRGGWRPRPAPASVQKMFASRSSSPWWRRGRGFARSPGRRVVPGRLG